jgi:hypothetical protein
MVHLGDEAQVDAHFIPFGDICKSHSKVGAQFAPNIPQAKKLFWTRLMALLIDNAQVED